MKKIYAIMGLAFLSFQAERTMAQSAFLFDTPDTLVYGDTLTLGDLACHMNFIINKTASPINIYVVRVQDVNLATGWNSYLCTDGQCFEPSVDSIPVTLAAYDSTEFIPHFGTTATPDSQTILMSVRNANNLSDVTYQRFHGVTQIGFGAGLHEYANLANVSIYPSPVTSGNDFSLNISKVKNKHKDFSLVVYTIYGSVAKIVTGLHEGNNTLNLGLPAGIYSYNLISRELRINSGNFSIIR